MSVYFEDSVTFPYSTAILKVWSRSTKLEEWAHGNLRKFNKSEYKVLQLGQGDPRHKYGLREEVIESVTAEKGLGVLVGEKLNISQQCVLIAQMAKCVSGWIRSSVVSRLREVILSHCSALVIPHQECRIQHWVLGTRKMRICQSGSRGM